MRGTSHTVAWGHVLCTVTTPSVHLVLEYCWTTNPKNAVKHRIALYENRVSIRRLSVLGKLLTSEGFQIGCECTANKEAEAENLYKWSVKDWGILQPLTHLGPKEHWQATIATNEHHCKDGTPSCPVSLSDC